VEYIEFLPGAIAAVAFTVRLVVFFRSEQRPRKPRLTAVQS
jgi:hypothetical protein